MNKKVGILTQPLGHNYGGILQAYALQHYLNSCGYKVTILNMGYFESPSFLFKIIHVSKTFIERLFLRRNKPYVFFNNSSELVNKKLVDFVNSKLPLTKKIDNRVKLYDTLKLLDLDVLIVGSDQVWRPKYSPFLPIYFFEGVNTDIKKVVYAASFGVDKWEYSLSQTKHYKKLLKNVDAISVREQSAVDLCKDFFDTSPTQVLDPTLLLDKEDYLSYNRDESIFKKIPRGCCISYVLDESGDKNKVISRICEEKKLLHYSIKDDCEVIKSGGSSLKVRKSIEEWLDCFNKSSFVITDSFHGCVFSILFKKPFYVLLNRKRGSSRFYSLLDSLGLLNRLSISCINEDIDWAEVDKKLEKLKTISFDFLQKNI